MNNMKIGIITYHSAYNYGSVLQALATQNAIENLGYSAEIVNYRMKGQKAYYQKLYRTAFGLKTLVKDLMMLPAADQRRERMERFEKFLKSYLHLSKEAETPEQANEILNQYGIVISGSDQIWNKHSNELENQDWSFMSPYLLEKYTGEKISYASSISNMTNEEIVRILPALEQFRFVSFRESSSNDRVNHMASFQAVNAPDPTFLLNQEQWIDLMKLKKENGMPYILYYSLAGIKTQKKRMDELRKLAEKEGCVVRIVTPFSYFKDEKGVFENHQEYGPKEFLEAIYNAKIVVTDSFHGTILSANLGKNLYSICSEAGSEFRKTDALKKIGLEHRIIREVEDIINKNFSPIDQMMVQDRISAFRDIGKNYLEHSLSVCKQNLEK